MKRALIVGAGPSLHKNLDEFDRLGNFQGIVIATDAAVQHMLKRNIIPTECTVLEDLPQLTKYFVPDIVKQRGHYIQKCWISERVHKEVKQSVEEANIPIEVAIKLRNLSTSNVGLFSTGIAHLIHECNEVHFIGMDHCYAENAPPPVPRSDPLFELGFYVMYEPHNDEELILNPAHELWREELHENLRLWKDLTIVNHTGRGAIFGKQIQWKPLEEINEWSESYL